jgi:hypothetical protein
MIYSSIFYSRHFLFEYFHVAENASFAALLTILVLKLHVCYVILICNFKTSFSIQKGHFNNIK